MDLWASVQMPLDAGERVVVLCQQAQLNKTNCTALRGCIELLVENLKSLELHLAPQPEVLQPASIRFTSACQQLQAALTGCVDLAGDCCQAPDAWISHILPRPSRTGLTTEAYAARFGQALAAVAVAVHVLGAVKLHPGRQKHAEVSEMIAGYKGLARTLDEGQGAFRPDAAMAAMLAQGKVAKRAQTQRQLASIDALDIDDVVVKVVPQPAAAAEDKDGKAPARRARKVSPASAEGAGLKDVYRHAAAGIPKDTKVKQPKGIDKDLCNAVAALNLERVHACLREGANPNAAPPSSDPTGRFCFCFGKPSGDGEPALVAAIGAASIASAPAGKRVSEENHASRLRADSGAGDHTRKTAAIVEALVRAGAQVNVETKPESTPLAWAAAHGHASLVTALIEAGAELEGRRSQQSERTPLMEASYHGNAAVIGILFRAGAKVEAATARGLTPLLLAATSGKAAAIDALLRAGARLGVVDDYGRTPLMHAAASGSAAAVEALSAAGAELEATDKDGHTAMFWARVTDPSAQRTAMDALLLAGAKPVKLDAASN